MQDCDAKPTTFLKTFLLIRKPCEASHLQFQRMISERNLGHSQMPNTVKRLAIFKINGHSNRISLGLGGEWLPLCLSGNTHTLGTEKTPQILQGHTKRPKDQRKEGMNPRTTKEKQLSCTDVNPESHIEPKTQSTQAHSIGDLKAAFRSFRVTACTNRSETRGNVSTPTTSSHQHYNTTPRCFSAFSLRPSPFSSIQMPSQTTLPQSKQLWPQDTITDMAQTFQLQ